MRIFSSSDLHLNVNFHQLENCTRFGIISEFAKYVAQKLIILKADVYIINGDISWIAGDDKIFIEYLKKYFRRTQHHCKILRTLGNHCLSKHYTVDEFLHRDFGKHYLVTNPIITEDFSIYGLNGFFDSTFTSNIFNDNREAVQTTLAKRYFKDEEPVSMDKLDYIVEEQLNLLRKQVENDTNETKILMTHFLPKKEFLSAPINEKLDLKNNFMGSTKVGDFLEEHNFTKCYFGHTHRRDYAKGVNINGITYVSNPLGTFREWKEHKYVGDVQFNIDLMKQQFKKTLMQVM